MSRYFSGIAAAAIFAIASAATASASPAAAPLLEGGYALAPFSFIKFCIDYPAECPKTAGPSRIRLTGERMAELTRVNHEVNDAIVPTPDVSALRYWRLNVDAGDCNAFAVQKRHELIQRGWPAAALALTVAKTSWGEGHLVVTVRTDKGDLVLDNLRPAIVPWQRTGYHWIMRQSERNPQYWADLHGGQAAPAYAERSLDVDAQVADAQSPAPEPVAVVPLPPRHPAASSPVSREPFVLEVAFAAARIELKRAQAAGDRLAQAFDARRTSLAIAAAEARAVDRALADAALWAMDNRDAVAPISSRVIAAFDAFVGAEPTAPAGVQAKLAAPIDPMQFGFL